MNLVVGTYGQRLYRLGVCPDSFSVSSCECAEVPNCSFFCLSDDGRFAYAISESGDNSAISAISLEGAMSLVSRVRCEAPDPCHIVLREGRLYTADYSGGSISVYPACEGRIGNLLQRVRFEGSGPDARRQASPHVHMLKFFGDTLYATDLGADAVHLLKVRPDGLLERSGDLTMPPGCGPRHIDISADGRFLYVLTELSNELHVFDRLQPVQLLKIGNPDFPTQAGGDVHIHPSGLWLYASLRNGDDSIVSFHINPANGRLARKQTLSTAAHPRNFVISPDGALLTVFCKNDRIVQFYDMDPRTGAVKSPIAHITLPEETDSPVFGLESRP